VFELKYNKEIVKKPYSEVKALAEMGMNYPKIKGRLDEYENDEGYGLLRELAAQSGLTHAEFIKRVRDDINEARAAELAAMGVPDDISQELLRLRDQDRRMRKMEQEAASQAGRLRDIDAQIAEFQRAYPKADLNSIPQAVFDICEKEGASLLLAYKMHASEERLKTLSEKLNINYTNERNAASSMGPASSSGSTGPAELTPESVKAMTSEQRRRLMPQIIRAIQSGRLQV
jgi:hypothetical protein